MSEDDWVIALGMFGALLTLVLLAAWIGPLPWQTLLLWAVMWPAGYIAARELFPRKRAAQKGGKIDGR